MTDERPQLLELAAYTKPEAAAILRVSERTLRKLVRDGVLRPRRYTRKHVFLGRAVIAFLAGEGARTPGVRHGPHLLHARGASGAEVEAVS